MGLVTKSRCLTCPRGYKIVFMLNSAEHEICPANKYQVTNKWVLREITWPVNDIKIWPTKLAYQLTVNVIA